MIRDVELEGSLLILAFMEINVVLELGDEIIVVLFKFWDLVFSIYHSLVDVFEWVFKFFGCLLQLWVLEIHFFNHEKDLINVIGVLVKVFTLIGHDLWQWLLSVLLLQCFILWFPINAMFNKLSMRHVLNFFILHILEHKCGVFFIWWWFYLDLFKLWPQVLDLFIFLSFHFLESSFCLSYLTVTSSWLLIDVKLSCYLFNLF